jgi:hypothetical protein
MQKFSKKIIFCFLIIAILEIGLFFNILITPAIAITKPQLQINIPTISLSESACQAGEDCSIPWIGEYIGGIYKYAINIVGILAAVVLMFGGAIWLTAGGNASRVTEAKAWVGASLTGLVLVLCSYMIMNIINPNLVVLKSLSISQATPPAQNTSTNKNCKWADTNNGSKLCKDVLTGSWINSDSNKCSGEAGANESCCCLSGGNETCPPVLSGNCSVDNMGCFGDHAAEASAICLGESGGGIARPSTTDKCQPGGEPVSWGLFQINLSAWPIGSLDCPSAFSNIYTGSNHNCTITDIDLYNKCVAAASDSVNNIQTACGIYNSRGWNQWGYNITKCQF